MYSIWIVSLSPETELEYSLWWNVLEKNVVVRVKIRPAHLAQRPLRLCPSAPDLWCPVAREYDLSQRNFSRLSRKPPLPLENFHLFAYFGLLFRNAISLATLVPPLASSLQNAFYFSGLFFFWSLEFRCCFTAYISLSAVHSSCIVQSAHKTFAPLSLWDMRLWFHSHLVFFLFSLLIFGKLSISHFVFS